MFKFSYTSFGLVWMLTSSLYAADWFYCTKNERSIKVGMTSAEVLRACGAPLSHDDSGTQQVPVQQMIYTTINSGSVYPGLNDAFYRQWSLPSGTTGQQLQVDIVNNKVSAILLNGRETKALSICNGGTFSKGDDISQLYHACGAPSMINQSHTDARNVTAGPDVWIYKTDAYQPAVQLNFSNGILQSIH